MNNVVKINIPLKGFCSRRFPSYGVYHIFAMAAEIEHDLISSRTKEALKARKAAGVVLGRRKGPGKSKLDQYKEEITALLKNGSAQKFIANRYKTTPANLHNWLKKNKINIVHGLS